MKTTTAEDIEAKKSVLNSLIKKLKVDQNGLLEIDFCVALGNTLYPVLPRANEPIIYIHTWLYKPKKR